MHRTIRHCNPARCALALAILALLPIATPAWSTPAAPAIAVAAPTRLAHGDAIVGALPMQAPIHVVIGLKLRNRAELESFVDANARAAMAGTASAPLSRQQVQDRHAPSAAQANAVAGFLAAHGFRNVTISPSGMLVTADGTARNARDAFATTFAQVRTRDGRLAYANTTEARVPAALSGIVEAVLGLQDVHVLRSHARRFAPGAVHPMATVAGHHPTEFADIYDAGTTAAATKVMVGIITEGDLAQTRTDLNTFTANHGLPTVVTQTINTGGTSGDTSGTGEWDLDSQDIVGIAGGVKRLVFYNMPDMTNAALTANLDTVVSRNAVKIINVSLGECESWALPGAQGGDGSAAIADALFLTAIAQGQTFSISTGDSGADECGNGGNTPSWPANSPYVIAAAGTRLSTNGTAWALERVWTDSGGSPSTYEPMPAWQSAFGVPGTTRSVADIAFDGDPSSGAIIYVNGSLAQYGGTSLSAPLFAGLWARVLQANSGIGFAGPLVYGLADSAFHDVTLGTNSGGQSGVGFTAGTGYDYASGRGSLKISDAVNSVRPLFKQILFNGGFESTASKAWTATPTSIAVTDAGNAHAGSRYARIGGDLAATDQIEQTVTIPAGKTLAILRYWIRVVTAETGSSTNDVMSVRLYDGGGHLLKTLATYSNRSANNNYVQKSFDVSAYVGQQVTLRFSGSNDASNTTIWRIDDVTLNVD
ncbi:MAG: xanthorhodopsin [Proteobacteria bacterium]|nr:xanthorhodopsin [Pseudomonadota bacterium]